MASAAVTIALAVDDPSAELRGISDEARGAAKDLSALEAASRAAAVASRDLRTALTGGASLGDAMGLIETIHGAEALDRALANMRPPKLGPIAPSFGGSLERGRKKAEEATKSVESLSKRAGDLGGTIARFAGMFSLPGLERAAPVVMGLGDSLELLSSPLGAAIGLTAAWGVAFGGTIVGAVALVAASDDLVARLDTIGRTDVITGAQLAQLDATRGAITSVGDAWAEVGLVLAAEFGPAVQAGAEIAVGATLKVAEAVEWLAGKADILKVVLNVLTGGALAQAEMALDALGIDIAGPGGLVDSIREEGRAYSETATEARRAAEEAKGNARAHSEAAREIRSAADIQFRSGLSGMSSTDVLPDSIRSDLDGFITATDRMQSGLIGLLDPIARADADFAALSAQIQADIAATGDLEGGIRLLSAAVDAHALAVGEARAQIREQTASTIGLGIGALTGDISGALGALGPFGGVAGMLVELGPESIETLDSALETIGDNILAVPETLAKLIGKILGFGADTPGQGIGRFLGAVGGGVVGGLLGGPAGAVAGAAVGSAALGQALGRSSASSRMEREMARRRGPPVVINGIVTGDVVRTLDRETRLRSGARGLRMSLARG